MNQQDAERITTEYLKPLFGFALKRCRTVQDAEDLSQETVLKIFRALLRRDDIQNVDKFIWTVAHNAAANYYRDTAKQGLGVSIDDMADTLSVPGAGPESGDKEETLRKLQSEIAYLSKLQRRIVIAYYYENRKQAEIASELKIPLGTVKWHLFEAKKELKRGINMMRPSSELKFNPVKFVMCSGYGSFGTKGEYQSFFHSALSQNIVYATRKEPKTINEIADILGVSPVYVESEAEYLEEYGFLLQTGGRYLCNILLMEPTNAIIRLHDEMYEKAAHLFANKLYDALLCSGLLNHERLWGGRFGVDAAKDNNFILWSLIPYIAAQSGEPRPGRTVSFEEAATLRPDGGQNICYASVFPPDVAPPKYWDSMRDGTWRGPCWNSSQDLTIWQIDSEWSDKRMDENYQHTVGQRDLPLLSRLIDGATLSEEEYAHLAQRGYIFLQGKPSGLLHIRGNCVWISGQGLKKELIAIGDHIKAECQPEFRSLKAPYVKAVMEATPKHLQKMQAYFLQNIFSNDGWFLLHCLKTLVDSDKLLPPTEAQKRSLSTVILSNK